MKAEITILPPYAPLFSRKNKFDEAKSTEYRGGWATLKELDSQNIRNFRAVCGLVS
jgi:hypothetical protein